LKSDKIFSKLIIKGLFFIFINQTLKLFLCQQIGLELGLYLKKKFIVF
jgi:hypothetical protein